MGTKESEIPVVGTKEGEIPIEAFHLYTDPKQITRIHGWHFISLLMKSPIVKTISLIPIIGYAILWSDAIKDFLKFNQLGEALWFSLDARLYLLYIGSLSVMIGYLIYFLKCPSAIKNHPNHNSYFDSIISTRNESYINDFIALMITDLKRSYRSYVRDNSMPEMESYSFETIDERHSELASKEMEQMLIYILEHKPLARSFFSDLTYKHYFMLNASALYYRSFCTFFITVGIGLMLLPSLEVFLMVWRKLLF